MSPPSDGEVNAAATVTVVDTRWLTVLQINSARDFQVESAARFQPTEVPFGDRVVAAPLDVLRTS
ncbi:MAG TPA: hypothetical protein VF635_16500 [Propionibacteriaceae bacterium]